LCSEITAEGRRVTKLDQILLNGNNIAIVSKKTLVVTHSHTLYKLPCDEFSSILI